ncbi:phage/plasmid primase, P4 family [Enterococcus sp. AZ007]|uniref:phage/plasmid primase, P4 family n=1 Tax=Enterococcus sp. AZ007 TaxID=2774839 RepID=UPI003F26C891
MKSSLYKVKGYEIGKMKRVQTDTSAFQQLWEYQPLSIDLDENSTKEQIMAAKKEALYFLSGVLKNAYRNNENLLCKDGIALDFDNILIGYAAFKKCIEEKLAGIRFILYPTISNYLSGKGMRFRLIIATDRTYTEKENAWLLQNIIDHIGQPCDTASKTWSQLMGLPVLNKLSPETLITKQEGEPLKVDEWLFEPEKKKPDFKPVAFTGELTHEKAVEMVQGYVDRVGDKLLDRKYYLNPYMNIRYAYQQGEIDLTTVEECLRILALGNDDWASHNIAHFYRDKGKVENGTPFTSFFGWVINDPMDDFGDVDFDDDDQTGKSKDTVKPLHIGIELREIEKSSQAIPSMDEQAEYMTNSLDSLNKATPSWFWAVPKIKRGKDGKVTKVDYSHGYDHVKMGDLLIKHFHLIRFPKLLQGAVYDNKRGYWRYFGKNEMKDFVERETLRALQSWGYYDIKHITPTRIYVIQKTYDKSYPSATPFETSKPELVVFRNGTYNILTGGMKENDPRDYILNAYDYDLITTGQPTPLTDALFVGLVGENALFLKQYLGYMFYRSHAPAQEMLFLKGNGGEGKSTFISYISNHLLGSDNYSAVTPQDLANDRFQVIELLGKAANISADIKDDFIEDSSILKRLTGGDPVYAQFKGIQGFKILSYAKMLYSANKLPKFKDSTDGFSDRLAVVPFINGNQRKEGATFWKDHNMDLIEKEAPAFAFACIQEFKKVFDGKKVQFTKTDSMEKEKTKWAFDNNHIAEFIIESTEINLEDPRGEIATKVHKEYQRFCKDNGYFPKTATAMREYLETLGVPKIRGRNGFSDGGSNQWRYKGLRLIVSYITEWDFDSE